MTYLMQYSIALLLIFRIDWEATYNVCEWMVNFAPIIRFHRRNSLVRRLLRGPFNITDGM